MGLAVHQGSEGFFRAVELHAHVALGDAKHLGDLSVAELVEVEQYESGVGLGQLVDRVV